MFEDTDTFQIKLKRRSPNAILPTRSSEQSPGYNLYSCEEKVILGA